MGTRYRLEIDPDGQFRLLADGGVMHRGQMPDGMTREEFGMRFVKGASEIYDSLGKEMVIVGHGYGDPQEKKP
jgi:hypothetical protein